MRAGFSFSQERVPMDPIHLKHCIAAVAMIKHALMSAPNEPVVITRTEATSLVKEVERLQACLSAMTALANVAGKLVLEPVEANQYPEYVDLVAHLHRQRQFSRTAFGPGRRTLGIISHIRRELEEILAAPTDLKEWIDVAILSFDGAWRAGHEPTAVASMLVTKQRENEMREWPDWRTGSPDAPIEHQRAGQ
jgi:dATP/dGTP pyrophosphohydrolase